MTEITLQCNAILAVKAWSLKRKYCRQFFLNVKVLYKKGYLYTSCEAHQLGAVKAEQPLLWMGVTKVIDILSVKLCYILHFLYIFCLPGHKGRVLHIALSPDHSRLFSVAADGIACLWKCHESGKIKHNSKVFYNGY